MAGVDEAVCFQEAGNASSPVAIAIPTSSRVAQRLEHFNVAGEMASSNFFVHRPLMSLL